MTNDARQIATKNSLIYSLFLNAKGRVLSDTIIYHVNHQDHEDPHFIIECDSKCKSTLLRLLHFYNIRKKIQISEEPTLRVLVNLNAGEAEQSIDGALFTGKDPRAVPDWCSRMLYCPAAAPETAYVDGDTLYRRSRYCLGVPEGVDEFKLGESLPLEANADLCHGVSFSKGCYVGQELTARSRFVGVTRRRIAPILFESSSKPSIIPLNSPIFRVSKADNKVVGSRPVGWVRGQEDPSPVLVPPFQHYGLALLRLAECAAAVTSGDRLVVAVSETAQVSEAAPIDLSMTYIVRPFAPSWWPEDIAIGLPRIQPFLVASSTASQ
ncbi:unnamed protein product [Hydatigera taeniaeformis]|uniref:GCV_T domain-containing protein n=1 Tax=Hydatigena taeniaeformis TaxID=6205 RepID=A0A0R3X3X1_HYDTA|nr:unnamed protein product [Hydatigera taeniaeformis]